MFKLLKLGAEVKKLFFVWIKLPPKKNYSSLIKDKNTLLGSTPTPPPLKKFS